MQEIELVENLGENFKEFNLLHRASIRIPKDKFKIKEIGYDEKSDFFEVNIDYQDAPEKISSNQTLSFAQFFGRALARTRINETLKSVWTFITSQDMEKTGTLDISPQILKQIAENIKNLVPSQNVSIVLWQKNKEVFCLFFSENEELMEKTANMIQIEKKDDYIIIGPYKNFSEAEIEVQKILKELFL